jgi:hypothetical protein
MTLPCFVIFFVIAFAPKLCVLFPILFHCIGLAALLLLLLFGASINSLQ